ncbi:hypothetical protein WMZ97_11180 [Lentibacillus sp. N15]
MNDRNRNGGKANGEWNWSDSRGNQRETCDNWLDSCGELGPEGLTAR